MISLVGGVLSALAAPAADPGVEALRWLDRADVRADFRRHVLQRRDTRLIGVHNVGAAIPGVDPSAQRGLFQQKRVRFIKGTSDAITSPEYGRLVFKAHEYAKRYNTMLLQHLRGRPDA